MVCRRRNGIIVDKKKGLLERLQDGVVIGDGSYVVNLEKRGYVTAGMWTPEAVIKYPEAVLQLHRDYLRAGADILTTFTFYSNDERFKVLDGQTNGAPGLCGVIHARDLNMKACDLARQVASEGDALVAGGFSPVRPFSEDKSKEHIQAEFKKQADVFEEKKVDCLLGEFFGTVVEAEWAIEVMKTLDIPIACSMRVPPSGDEDGILPQECAVRMAKAGADVVGVNCMYDPTITLKTLDLMKRGLEEAGIKAYLMAQPLGYHTQEIENDPRGYIALPEFPFAMEPRLLTRMDVHTFTRKAYELGVKYIGGCCGYEPYHIRASAEELAAERGRRPPGADNHEGFKSLERSSFKDQWERANPEYWANLVPAAGRMIKLLATE